MLYSGSRIRRCWNKDVDDLSELHGGASFLLEDEISYESTMNVGYNQDIG